MKKIQGAANSKINLVFQRVTEKLVNVRQKKRPLVEPLTGSRMRFAGRSFVRQDAFGNPEPVQFFAGLPALCDAAPKQLEPRQRFTGRPASV
jgi:hypothetical protein